MLGDSLERRSFDLVWWSYNGLSVRPKSFLQKFRLSGVSATDQQR